MFLVSKLLKLEKLQFDTSEYFLSRFFINNYFNDFILLEYRNIINTNFYIIFPFI